MKPGLMLAILFAAIAASAAFAAGSRMPVSPSCRAAAAIGSTPRIPLMRPSRESSPTRSRMVLGSAL